MAHLEGPDAREFTLHKSILPILSCHVLFLCYIFIYFQFLFWLYFYPHLMYIDTSADGVWIQEPSYLAEPTTSIHSCAGKNQTLSS